MADQQSGEMLSLFERIGAVLSAVGFGGVGTWVALRGRSEQKLTEAIDHRIAAVVQPDLLCEKLDSIKATLGEHGEKLDSHSETLAVIRERVSRLEGRSEVAGDESRPWQWK